MTEYLTNLVSDKNVISRILKSRSKQYIEKNITGKTVALVKEKARLEEKDGWETVKIKKKAAKLRKLKSFDIILEDEIWSILVKMGFDEFSKDRTFKIFIDETTPPRQIDVFAKDSNTVLLFECTTCEERKEKNLNSLIEKILSIRSEVYNSINKHYKSSIKLKIRWLIATKNIDWRDIDLEKARVNNIVVIRDEEIAYYKKLTDHLKSASKYQLLAHVFSNEKIHGLDLQVPATRGKMGGVTFYNFLIKPADLLKIAYVSHKQSRKVEDADTYQRMLGPKRLKNIAQYVDKGGQFPTNIVINIKTSKKIRFDKIQDIGESSFGTLYLPNHYASSWIIDGQHRLYGFAHSKRFIHGDDKTTFPVLAYENLPQATEAKLFVDINCEQVRVKRSLLNEIYANLNWDSDDFKEKQDALCSRIVMSLNTDVSSPCCDRIFVSSTDKTHTRCLTLTSFVDGLKENKFFGEKKTVFKPGVLYASYDDELEKTHEKAQKVLNYYFNLYKKALPEHWDLGDAPGGFLCTNNGLRALLRILKEILLHIQDQRLKVDLDDLPADDIVGYLDNYVSPITAMFGASTSDLIQRFRNRQALAGVNQNACELMSFIHNDNKDFCPEKLKTYLDTIDQEGTIESRSLIDDIQLAMHNFVIRKLKEKHGDEWWYSGVPEKVRTRCSDSQEKEKGVKQKEQYLLLIDYYDIAFKEWELFGPFFSQSKDGGKEKKLKWVQDLNTIRNITHHVEKWPATKDQVKFVRNTHKYVKETLI